MCATRDGRDARGGLADAHMDSSGKVIFGNYDDYHAAAQCAPGIVFFVVSGLILESNSDFRERLR